MTNRFWILFIICFIVSIQLPAQWLCGFDDMHQSLLQKDALYKSAVDQVNKSIYDYSINYYKSNKSRSSKPLYVLPVVVHLIVPPGTPIGQGNNLTNLQVELGLDYLNQAFANSGPYNTSIGVDV